MICHIKSCPYSICGVCTNWNESDCEYKDYRAIGNVEECREAVEKQKPKRPEYYGDNEAGKILCPNCQDDLWDLKECGFNNCPYCGQAIDWSDDE